MAHKSVVEVSQAMLKSNRLERGVKIMIFMNDLVRVGRVY